MNVSVKNVPLPLVRALRERAERHHRSLQGELMAILEESVAPGRGLSPRELLAEARRLGISTAASSVDLIRQDRDGR
jgi:plasmid stability protein